VKRREQFALYLSTLAIAGLLGSSALAQTRSQPKAAKPVATPAPVRPTPAAQPAAPVKVAAPAQPAVVAEPVTPIPLPRQTGPVAADVNADKVMVADVDRILTSMKSREPSLAIDSAEAKATLATLRQTILENLITHRIMYQEAVRLKIGPTAAEVDATFIDFKNNFRTEEEFNKAMQRDGKTALDMRRMIIEEMSIRMLTEHWTAGTVVKEADIEKYYNENTAQFLVPESVRARHILVKVDKNTSPTEKARLKKRATDLLAKAQGRNDFATLAKENSDDRGSKENGGDLSFFTREEMVKPFSDAAFSTPAKTVHGKVVESAFGFHIIKVEEVKAARTMAFVELKSALAPLVLKLLIQDKIEQQIEALRTRATIKKYI